jgi:crossover junction endodeoxyribonuclease RuvC
MTRHEGPRGLDPGVTGAMAILDGSSVVLLEDLPVHMISAGRKQVRPELDLHQLHAILAEHAPFDHAYVERVTARPGNGSVSMFRFGQSYGGIIGVLTTMGIAMTLVQPKDWQRWAGCGPAPDAARQRAAQLFPSEVEQLSRKKDCHRADALLLAHYGLCTLQQRATSQAFPDLHIVPMA